MPKCSLLKVNFLSGANLHCEGFKINPLWNEMQQTLSLLGNQAQIVVQHKLAERRTLNKIALYFRLNCAVVDETVNSCSMNCLLT